MGKFHIKSILLGIGIGIILTSIMGIIYAAGTNTYRDLSDDEIRELATKLGMVDSNEFISDGKDVSSSDNVSSSENVSSSGKNSVKVPEGQDDTLPEGQDDASTSPSSDSNEQSEAESSDIEAPMAEEKVLIISPGDTSGIVAGKLLEAGIIDDQEEFLRKIDQMGLAGDINIGEFAFEEGEDIEVIINVITE